TLRNQGQDGPRTDVTARKSKAGQGPLASHRGGFATADRIDEGNQLGAQRLRIADGQVPHRIAAVWLEAKAFSHLKSEQIADEIFVAGGDMNRASLKRRQPIRVDVRKHP